MKRESERLMHSHTHPIFLLQCRIHPMQISFDDIYRSFAEIFTLAGEEQTRSHCMQRIHTRSNNIKAFRGHIYNDLYICFIFSPQLQRIEWVLASMTNLQSARLYIWQEGAWYKQVAWLCWFICKCFWFYCDIVSIWSAQHIMFVRMSSPPPPATPHPPKQKRSVAPGDS